ncbi:hypothetical protein AB0Q95_06700 [Streptomyces sp. NPDC059900]|uniref:hypothetical protein n=1 Tax=Streptomyces sp. NPDC059900 TaxID=3155816 RepID=UPI00343585A0
MTDQPWTIDRIHDVLGAPALASRFLSEINKAPAHELLHVFARWEHIAKNLEAAFDDESTEAARRGEEPPGEWIDGTQRLDEAAARIRSRGAA